MISFNNLLEESIGKHCGKKKNNKKKNPKKQDVFVKHECPRNGHFLRNVTFMFDLDLCR